MREASVGIPPYFLTEAYGEDGEPNRCKLFLELP